MVATGNSSRGHGQLDDQPAVAHQRLGAAVEGLGEEVDHHHAARPGGSRSGRGPAAAADQDLEDEVVHAEPHAGLQVAPEPAQERCPGSGPAPCCAPAAAAGSGAGRPPAGRCCGWPGQLRQAGPESRVAVCRRRAEGRRRRGAARCLRRDRARGTESDTGFVSVLLAIAVLHPGPEGLLPGLGRGDLRQRRAVAARPGRPSRPRAGGGSPRCASSGRGTCRGRAGRTRPRSGRAARRSRSRSGRSCATGSPGP